MYRAAGHQYVLKIIAANDFGYFQGMNNDPRSCPYVRTAEASIHDQSMFAYQYLEDHLLSFAQTNVPLVQTKRVLRDSFRGFAASNEKEIVYGDVRANNIVIDWEEKNGKTVIHQVQIADIDDNAYVPEGKAIVGRQMGNWMW